MAKEQNLFPLKLLVFSMAALLIGGMVVLVAAVAGKVRGVSCPGGEVALEVGEKIEHIDVHSETIYVTAREGGGWTIRALDACSGEERRRIRLRENVK